MSAETKYTNGEFRIEGNEIIAGSTLIGELYNDFDFSRNPKREGIDRLPTREEAEANAKLIKAAPKMLNLLLEEKREIKNLIQLSSWENLTDEAKSRYDRICAIIEQATE